jgi:hypothetical protein
MHDSRALDMLPCILSFQEMRMVCRTSHTFSTQAYLSLETGHSQILKMMFKKWWVKTLIPVSFCEKPFYVAPDRG